MNSFPPPLESFLSLLFQKALETKGFSLEDFFFQLLWSNLMYRDVFAVNMRLLIFGRAFFISVVFAFY